MARKGRPRGDAMTGAELRRVRQNLGLTQVELAQKLGTTSTSVARWERDEVGIGEPVARLIRFVASSVPKPRRAKRRRGRTDGAR